MNIMLKTADLCHALELAVPPLAGCEDFDGVAFMPDGDRPVKRVAVALDADIFTARAAVGAGADILLTHHPMLYGGEPEAGSPQYLARAELAAHGIAAMSLHARLDAAEGGINDSLCAIIGVFAPDSIIRFGIPEACGLGRIGTLSAPMSGEALAMSAKAKLGSPCAVVSCAERTISRAAVVSGSCSDFVTAAAECGADAIIGGEFKYHTLELARVLGICCIGLGHYYTERHAPDILRRLVLAAAPDAEVTVVDPGCPARIL